MVRWRAAAACCVATLLAVGVAAFAGAARAEGSGPAPGARVAPDSAAATPGDSVHERPPRWALVLSGGMARGLAQVGVIQALDEQGIRPDLVVGSSMGGLVGALYASGLSGLEIERVVTHMDWQAVLDTREDLRSWRGMGMPRPWLRLLGGGLKLHLPPSIKDDAYMNFVLVETLLEGGLRCGGNFDSLPIPLRIITTDPQRLLPVVLSSGDLARAVRATLGVPVVFPPVTIDGRLLVDGGTASNLPVGFARAAGAERVLAVDVAIPSPVLSEDSNALLLAAHFLDMLNKRGQVADTIGARDRLIWLRLPGVSVWDFPGARRMIGMGLRASRDSVRAFARELGIPTGRPLPAHSPLVIPPVAGAVEWTDRFGKPFRRKRTASAVLGALPEGPLRLWRMRQAYQRLYRSDLFESAWPRITVTGDSTLGRFEVRERPAQELQLAAAYNNDIDMRAHAALILRRRSGPLPAYASVQVAADRLGWRTQASFEGTSLQRGITGWFLRGGAGEQDTRLYDEPGLRRLARTSRQEVTLGGQLQLPLDATVQAGAGYGRAHEDAGNREGVLAALRAEANGVSRPRLEVVTMGGHAPYSSATASADVQLGLGPFQVVPAVRAGAATAQTPLDELPALGGPRSFAGLRHGEWRGRRMLGLELCVLRHLQGDLLCHVAVQAGRIEKPVSRADLGERFRSAIELGVELSTPFGPLRADFGFPQGAAARFDVGLGLGF
jgi:predicted acylesterase/phospholipase RssA